MNIARYALFCGALLISSISCGNQTARTPPSAPLSSTSSADSRALNATSTDTTRASAFSDAFTDDTTAMLMQFMPDIVLAVVSYSSITHDSRMVAVCRLGGTHGLWVGGGENWDNTDLWEINISTHEARRLTSSSAALSPDYSPNGKSIAYIESGSVVVMDIASRRRKTLLNASLPDTYMLEASELLYDNPKWSPGGSAVATVGSNGATAWVRIVDPRSGRTIYQSRAESYGFRWLTDMEILLLGEDPDSMLVRLPNR